jgi:N-acetylmuramoyl-L-alanine amidase
LPTPESDQKISLTSEQLELIAKIVYLEARGEPVRGQQLVAEVILSRVLSDRFPDTVEGVLSAPGQFATWATINTAYPTEIQYAAVQAAIETPESEYNIIYFSRRAQNSRIYEKVGNHVFCYI